jgi:hypothetical protein
MTCTWLPHISHKHLESYTGVPGYRWIHFDGDMPLLPWLAEAACLVRWRGLLCVDGNWEYKRVRGPGFRGDINKRDINKKKQNWIKVCRRILLQHRSAWPVGCTQETFFLFFFFFKGVWVIFCMNVCIAPSKASRGVRSSGTRAAIVSCHRGAGGWTNVLWLSRHCSKMLSHLFSPYSPIFKNLFHLLCAACLQYPWRPVEGIGFPWSWS